MSFILDALKKSEARRRLGETPGLDGPVPAGSSAHRAGWPWLAILATLVVALLAVLLWREFATDRLFGAAGDPAPAAAGPRPAAEQPAAGPVRSEPLQLADRSEATARGDRAGPNADTATSADRAAGARVASADADRAAREVIGPERSRSAAGETARTGATTGTEMAEPGAPDLDPRSAAERAAPARDRSRTAEPTESAATQAPEATAETDPVAGPKPAEREAGSVPAPPAAEPGAESAPATPVPPVAAEPESKPEPEPEPEPKRPEWIERWELPPDVRREMPEMNLTVHVWAEQPAGRFVLVNGQRYGEGDALADGVKLVKITREGAVVGYRDYRFMLRQ